MKECKVIIMGFGSVGQGVANALSMKKDLIKDKILKHIEEHKKELAKNKETIGE